MSVKIISVMDHYEIYVNGKFYCSADTIKEAATMVEELECGL